MNYLFSRDIIEQYYYLTGMVLVCDSLINRAQTFTAEIKPACINEDNLTIEFIQQYELQLAHLIKTTAQVTLNGGKFIGNRNFRNIILPTFNHIRGNTETLSYPDNLANIDFAIHILDTFMKDHNFRPESIESSFAVTLELLEAGVVSLGNLPLPQPLIPQYAIRFDTVNKFCKQLEPEQLGQIKTLTVLQKQIQTIDNTLDVLTE